jgi:hypothetical protein
MVSLLDRKCGRITLLLILLLVMPDWRRTRLHASDATPDALLHEAIETELRGPSATRQSLLAEAVERDANFAPARWQLGFVRLNNQWLSIDDVPSSVDGQYAAYRTKREGLSDSKEDQRMLARWCADRGMRDIACVHWTKVIEQDPKDFEALAALGMIYHNGVPMTKRQMVQVMERYKARQAAIKRFAPQILKLEHAASTTDVARRRAAINKLRSLAEPSSVEAMGLVITEKPGLGPVRQAMIEAIGSVQQPEASQVLTQLALFANGPKIRAAAIAELRKRPPYAYVPQLIGAMPPVIGTRYQVYLAPDGTVVHDHQIFEHGALADNQYWAESQVRPVRMQDPKTSSHKIERVMNEAAAVETQILARNMQNQFLCARIKDVLAQTTDLKLSDDPEEILKQWVAYNDSYLPPRAAPTTYSSYRVRYMSCFPAGTPIETLAGPMRIEKIKPGDSVLSQNPRTGELAYKLVQGVTLRPPAPLIGVGVGSEAIHATRGHPFWVNGQGWLMTKQLKVGMILHCINGAIAVDELKELSPEPAYNLVVSDFNTYFVGASRVLVHDNMLLEEPGVLVPGLVAANANQAENLTDLAK